MSSSFLLFEPLLVVSVDDREPDDPPDNSRAGLVWEISDKPYFQEISAPEAARWGVTFPNAMTSRENVRNNLESILPELKKRWEEWRRANLNK